MAEADPKFSAGEEPFAVYLAKARAQVDANRTMRGLPEHFEGVARALAVLNRAGDRARRHRATIGFVREAHTGLIHCGEGE